MEINPEHIRQAEALLINGYEFDEERKEFITNLETCDLLAVPGSGKTTALIAKLYCIDKQLPLKNNRGVLVLSHTNKAVEEIEKVLKPVCPRLFSYPNFVGTIQSFVNRFIANQACYEKFGSYISKNDDELIFEEILSKVKRNYRCISFLERKKRKGEDLMDIIKSIKYGKEKFYVKGKPLSFTSNSGKFLKQVYDSLKNSGVIFYSESFQVAKEYIDKHPELLRILRNRFNFIFIDEMQDLDGEQVRLLEAVFIGEDAETNNVIQRIGDKNQAIYSNSNSLTDENIWVTRNEEDPDKYPENLSLQKSYRLSPKIADLVDGFILKRTTEDYKVTSGKEGDIDLPPYLIVYDDENDAEKLKSTFRKLIKEKELDKSQKNRSNGYHIIAWTAEKEGNPDKWHLKKLFPNYSKEKGSRKDDFNCLAKYLYNFDRNIKTFAGIRKSLLNGITRVLRISGVVDPTTGKPYRKSGFIREVKSKGDKDYNSFKQQLFQWCYKIVIDKNYTWVFIEYLAFINDRLKSIITDFTPSKAYSFILGGDVIPWVKGEPEKELTQEDDILIQLSTIHGVKGQTHCATMYVETEYYDYETEKLFHMNTTSNPLFFKEQQRKGGSRKRYDNALKMMYVGFSRPTHLLCFAVKRENIEDYIDEFEKSGWAKMDLKEIYR